jgi:hypothetical protein
VTRSSIERRSTLDIQRGQDDDTKAYGRSDLVLKVAGYDPGLCPFAPVPIRSHGGSASQLSSR